jgi:aromatic ring-cleaving dioxygenase
MLNQQELAMLNKDLQHLPIDFRRHFDAHIYYSFTTRSQAEILRNKAVQRFQSQAVFIGPLIDELIGPHPQPMFEINYSKEFYTEMLIWFNEERENLNILIHPVTGDDPKDHFEKALWLGEPQPLDASKLDPSPT